MQELNKTDGTTLHNCFTELSDVENDAQHTSIKKEKEPLIFIGTGDYEKLKVIHLFQLICIIDSVQRKDHGNFFLSCKFLFS